MEWLKFQDREKKKEEDAAERERGKQPDSDGVCRLSFCTCAGTEFETALCDSVCLNLVLNLKQPFVTQFV